MRALYIAVVLLTAYCTLTSAQETRSSLQLPEQVVAGSPVSIPTSGTGEATLYLIGPGHVVRRKIKLGHVIEIRGDETRDSGRYVVVVSQGNRSMHSAFFAFSAEPESLSFLARPSRLPVAVPEGISGVVYPFDKFHNLVLQPEDVNFRFSIGGSPVVLRKAVTRNGVAWTRIDSSRKAGHSELIASIGDVSIRRVIHEVASDPCNLRISAQRTSQGILVRTAPIVDCTGNPVPDGTIVTFTAVEPKGKTTVDMPIKRGIAQAELPLAGNALISVASGVVIGNEIRWGGQQ